MTRRPPSPLLRLDELDVPVCPPAPPPSLSPSKLFCVMEAALPLPGALLFFREPRFVFVCEALVREAPDLTELGALLLQARQRRELTARPFYVLPTDAEARTALAVLEDALRFVAPSPQVAAGAIRHLSAHEVGLRRGDGTWVLRRPTLFRLALALEATRTTGTPAPESAPVGGLQ